MKKSNNKTFKESLKAVTYSGAAKQYGAIIDVIDAYTLTSWSIADDGHLTVTHTTGSFKVLLTPEVIGIFELKLNQCTMQPIQPVQPVQPAQTTAQTPKPKAIVKTMYNRANYSKLTGQILTTIQANEIIIDSWGAYGFRHHFTDGIPTLSFGVDGLLYQGEVSIKCMPNGSFSIVTDDITVHNVPIAEIALRIDLLVEYSELHYFNPETTTHHYLRAVK